MCRCLGPDVFAHVYADACILSCIDKTHDGGHHLVQRDRRPDLVIGRSPEQGLNILDVIDNAAELFWCLAVGVAGSGRQPPHQHLERGAQQDDVVELRMELRLVLLTASDEQHVGVFCGQKCLDGVFPPPLSAVRQGLGSPVVGVDSFEPAGG